MTFCLQLVQLFLPCSSPNPPTSPTFLFAGQSLKLADRACHLGHILSSDLSDTDDILRVQTDMCRRANCLLSTFYAANPAVKTLLFRSFCLSLYGSALWKLSSSSLRSLEVTFNNLLRKIWKLPRHCHTSALVVFKVVIYRSSMHCQKARSTGIHLICDIFTDALQLSYTTFGFNVHNYNRYWRTYTDADIMCSNFIRDVKLFPQENRGLIDEIYYLCTY